jgi:hypothetical protein
MLPDADFAGESYSYPESGERVLIMCGKHAGKILVVDSVRGNAFAAAYRIYVFSPKGLVWYWPWNIEVLPSGS